MSITAVEEFFKAKGKNVGIRTFGDTSTVEKAAQSLGVTPGEIAKSLLLQANDSYVMILMAGDKRIDNKKFKEVFKAKAKMPQSEEVEKITGHVVGGVCPFGLKTPVPVYLDDSLRAYHTIYPAAGAPNAAVKMSVEELREVTSAQWVDIAQI